MANNDDGFQLYVPLYIARGGGGNAILVSIRCKMILMEY